MLKTKVKIYLLSVLISLISINTYAWERHSDTTFLISFQAGLNSTNISTYDFYPESTVGHKYQLSAILHLHQEYSVSTGLAFMQKGYEHESPYNNIFGDPIGNYRTINSFNYWNIPFTGQYNLGRRKFNVYLNLGLEFNILRNQVSYSNEVPDYYEGIEVVNEKIDRTNIYRRLNVAYHAGVGIEYKIFPALSVFLDGKYFKDFTNNYKREVNSSLKHYGYSVSFGVKLGIPITYRV